MGPLSNSQRNVTKPRARFSAPLEAPRDPLHSGMATLAAVPLDPIFWQWNTSVGTPQTPPGPEATGCGHFLKPGGSGDALCTMGQPRWVYQMCLRMSCHWCWLLFFFFLFRGMLSVPQDLPEGKPQDSGGWRSRHQCLPSGWRQDPGSEARAAQGRTPRPAGSYMTRNKGHLALSRGIKLMSKAPETTLPSHRQPWQRKKALTSK